MFSFRHEATPSVVSPTNRSGRFLVELHSLGVKLTKGNSSLWGLHFWYVWAELTGATSPLESAEHEVSDCYILQRSLQRDAPDTEPLKGLLTSGNPGMPVA